MESHVQRSKLSENSNKLSFSYVFFKIHTTFEKTLGHWHRNSGQTQHNKWINYDHVFTVEIDEKYKIFWKKKSGQFCYKPVEICGIFFDENGLKRSKLFRLKPVEKSRIYWKKTAVSILKPYTENGRIRAHLWLKLNKISVF